MNTVLRFGPARKSRLSEVSASYTYFEDNDVLLAKSRPASKTARLALREACSTVSDLDRASLRPAKQWPSVA